MDSKDFNGEMQSSFIRESSKNPTN